MINIINPDNSKLIKIDYKLPSIFLGGGISGCSDWQSDIIQNLLKYENNLPDTNIFNPRRKDFDTSNQLMTIEQIEWEFCFLQHYQGLKCFWFTSETLCPITLFELGTFTKDDRAIVVGIDPNYLRKIDLQIQLPLYKNYFNSSITVVESFNSFTLEIIKWIRLSH